MWMVYVPILVICLATARGPRCEIVVAPIAALSEKACVEALTEMGQATRHRGIILGVAGICLRRGLDLVL